MRPQRTKGKSEVNQPLCQVTEFIWLPQIWIDISWSFIVTQPTAWKNLHKSSLEGYIIILSLKLFLQIILQIFFVKDNQVHMGKHGIYYG